MIFQKISFIQKVNLLTKNRCKSTKKIAHEQIKFLYSCIFQKKAVILRKFLELVHVISNKDNFEKMAKFIVMAEEGELGLIEQVKQLGVDIEGATLVYTGVGAINVIRSLQHLDREAEIYNIGYAGSANFDVGTWVEVTEVRLNHPNVTYKEPELKLSAISRQHSGFRQAVCYTNTDFVLQSDYKDCVFDMELAFIAALGFKHVHSFKYVSDNLSLHAYHDLTNGVQ